MQQPMLTVEITNLQAVLTRGSWRIRSLALNHQRRLSQDET